MAMHIVVIALLDIANKIFGKFKSMRFLKISIHLSHIAWMVALSACLSEAGSLTGYIPFLPLIVLAFCLEILRWEMLGRTLLEINGAYALASAIDSINFEYFKFSWYVIAPSPPFQLLSRYAEKVVDLPAKKLKNQIFSRFWLKSEVTPVLIGALLLLFTMGFKTPPELFGLGRVKGVPYLFWLIEFGLLGKLISIAFYSLITRLHKGL